MMFIIPAIGQSQTNNITVDQAIEIALKNNLGLKASAQRIEQGTLLIESANDINKTDIYFNRDQNNIAPNNIPLNVWGIGQSIQFPTVYGAQRKVLQGKAQLITDQYKLDKYTITKEVSKSYYEIVYWQRMLIDYNYLDSIYTSFEYAAKRRFDQGETNYLEKLTAETKKKEMSLKLKQIKESIKKSYIQLNQWLQVDTSFTVSDAEFKRISVKPNDTNVHPIVNYYEDAMKLSTLQVALEKQKLLPDLNASVFQGLNNGIGKKSYLGFQLGASIPLWRGSQRSKISAARLETIILEDESNNYKAQLTSKYEALQSDLRQYEEGLIYYETTGKKLTEETLFHANIAYKNGEINFLQYIQLLDNAKSIETNYITTLFQYNMTALEANYLMK